MASNDLDDFFGTPTTLANPQGFSEPTVPSNLDSFLSEPQNIDEMLDSEPEDVAVEDDDRGIIDWWNENVMENLHAPYRKETWQGLGDAAKLRWERVKLGLAAMGAEQALELSQSSIGNPEVEALRQQDLDRVYNDVKRNLQTEAELTPQNLTLMQKGIRGAVLSAPDLAVTAGLTAATRSPIPAMTYGGTLTGLESKATAGAEGVTGQTGTTKAKIDALLEGAFSFLPTKKLGELMDAAKLGDEDTLQKAVQSVTSELKAEQLTTATQTINDYVHGLDEQLAAAQTWQEAAAIQAERQAVSAISTTLLSGGFAGGLAAMKSPVKLQERVSEEKAMAEQEAQPFTGPMISQDLLRARLDADRTEKKFQDTIAKVNQENDALAVFLGDDIPTMTGENVADAQIDYLNVYKDGKWIPAKQAIAEQEAPGVYTADLNDWLSGNDPVRTKAAMEYADFQTRARPVLESWQKDLLPDTSIILGAIDPQASKLGSARVAKGVGRILTNPFNFGNAEFSDSLGYSIMAHEFGHLFANTEYQKLGPKAKLALEYEYLTWKAQQTPDTLMSDIQKTRDTPIDVASLPLGDKTLQESEDNAPNWTEYYLSRKEYMAQQMARYQTYDNKAMKVARPFFTSLVAKLKKFHKEHGNQFAPTETFQAWVNSLSAKNKRDRLEVTERDRVQEAWNEVQTASVDKLAPAQYKMAEVAETNFRFQEWNKVYGPQAPYSTERVSSLEGKLNSPEYKENLDTGRDNMSRFKKNFLTLLQNAKNNPHIPGLLAATPDGKPGFVKIMEDHANRKRAESKRNDTILKDWRKLGALQATRVGDLAVKVEDLSREAGRRLTPGEIAREAMLMSVDSAGLDLYNRIQGEFDRKVDQLEEALVARANRMQWADEAGKQEYLKNTTERLNTLRNRNYFPASRFGNHVVTVKATEDGTYKGKFYSKGDTLLREQYETAAEADERAESLRKQNIGQKNVVARDKIPNYSVASYQGLPPTLLEELMRRLPEDQHQSIRDAMAAAAPGQGFAKHLIRKQGIAGASKNFRRSYLSYMESFDRHLSRILEEDQFDDAIKAVSDSANNLVLQGKDASKRRLVQEMMVDTKNYLFNPGEEFKSWGALAFNYYLSGVPKHALLAMIQLPMVSFPNLSAQYGTLNTTQAFTRAMGRIYSGKMDLTKLPVPLQDALQQAEKDGIIEETLMRELGTLAQANNLDRLVPRALGKGDTIAQGWSNFANVAGAMFHYAEKFARLNTFHAAWDLEWRKSGDSVRAYQAAKDAVQRGHFVFTAHNNPPIMRGKARPLFVFQTHVQGMLEFLLGSNNPGKWRGLAMLLMAAGASGMPFAEDMEELLNWVIKKYNKATGDYSTPPTVKENIRKELVEMMNVAGEDSAKLFADLALDGAGKWGFGLPWAGEMTGIPTGSFDLTPSLGLGSIIPGMKALNAKDWNQSLSQATEGVAGPALGIPLGMLQAMTESQASDEWRLGKFLPAMIENPMKTVHWADKGMEDKYGRKVLDFDPDNPSHKADAIWQAMGMVPSRLSVERDARWAAQRTNEYYATARTGLIMQLEEAVKSGEQEAIADVTKAIMKFNDTVPYPGYKLNASAIMSGIKARLKRDMMSERGMPARLMDIPATQEIRGSFPVEPTGQPQ